MDIYNNKEGQGLDKYKNKGEKKEEDIRYIPFLFVALLFFLF